MGGPAIPAGTTASRADADLGRVGIPVHRDTEAAAVAGDRADAKAAPAARLATAEATVESAAQRVAVAVAARGGPAATPPAAAPPAKGGPASTAPVIALPAGGQAMVEAIVTHAQTERPAPVPVAVTTGGRPAVAGPRAIATSPPPIGPRSAPASANLPAVPEVSWAADPPPGKATPGDPPPAAEPIPMGSDLLDAVLPFDREAIERSFDALLERFEEVAAPSIATSRRPPSLVTAAAALAAVEAARRWQRRRANAAPTLRRGPRSSALRGLF